MDNYKKDNPKSGEPKPPASAEPASAPAHPALADSFRSSGTGSLAKGSTRRLQSSALDPEKAIEAMRIEVDNGKLIVSKLESRIAVLYRAVRIVEKPIDVNAICQGTSAGEANFTKQVAKMLQSDPHTTRRVQVALYQWDQALGGLKQAEEALGTAVQYGGPVRAQYVEQNLHVEKLRGQLYPLINLHVVFRDNALIAQLLPPPKAHVEPLPPPRAAGSDSAAPVPATGTLGSAGKLAGLVGLPGMLGTGRLPPSPSPAAPASPTTAAAGIEKITSEAPAAETAGPVTSALKAATGSLRHALLGMLGGVPKEDADKKPGS
jgi:hypothetical protein